MAELSATQEVAIRIVEATAWPAVALLGILILRKPLTDLIERLRRAGWGNKTLEFESQLLRLEEEGKQVAPVQEPEFPELSADETADLASLARLSPRAAITESWVRLEHTLRSKAKTVGGEPDRRRPIHSALETLRNRTDLSASFFHVVEELRQVRNRAVHDLDFPPPRMDVSGYVRTSARLAEAAAAAKPRPIATLRP